MSATIGTAPAGDHPGERKAVMQRMFQVFGQMIMMGALLFLTAWDIGWLWAWVYLGLALVIVVIFAVFFLPGHTDMIAERARVKAGTKQWDRVLTPFLFVIGLGMYATAGLDHRFGWTGPLPLWAHLAAAGVMVLGFVVLYWAMLSNRFFATTVRIQTERDHRVVDSGPYHFVRHPGYVGIMLHSTAALVLLGSLWALIPGAIGIALYVVRTALEDRTLQAELPGYREYAQKTRYRLIPGIY